MCNYLKGNIDESDSELRKAYDKELSNVSKNLNMFIALTKFQITMNNERAVNANYIIKQAYAIK